MYEIYLRRRSRLLEVYRSVLKDSQADRASKIHSMKAIKALKEENWEECVRLNVFMEVWEYV